MARERKSNPRKMKPLFLVLCEGETEETYISLLKQRYRLPIRIVSKILGGSLYPKKIEQYKKEMSECVCTSIKPGVQNIPRPSMISISDVGAMEPRH